MAASGPTRHLPDISPPVVPIPQTPFWAWNRLEGRPRKQDFSNVLKARIHDPLWMLGRQWQMGEYKGTDSGTGIAAKAEIKYQKIVAVNGLNATEPIAYDLSKPLEPMIEAVTYNWSIKERLLMGKKWLFFLSKSVIAGAITSPQYDALILKFTNAPYPLGFSLDATEPTSASSDEQIISGAAIFSDNETADFIKGNSLSGNIIDGGVVFEVVKNITASTPGTVVNSILEGILSPAIASSPPPVIPGMISYAPLQTAIVNFNKWVNKMYSIPAPNKENWVPQRLEYQFDTYWGNVAGAGNARLFSTAYHGGHFDWYSFIQDTGFFTLAPDITPSATGTFRRQVLMAKASFPGMPASRWWEFEEGNVNFCKIDADTTDIAKIVLTQFALLFQDDWFVIPCRLPVGSYSKISGIAVTDVFGVKTYIPNYSSRPTPPSGTSTVIPSFTEEPIEWKSWRWMDISKKNDVVSATHAPAGCFILTPAVNGILESKPIESVLFMKDEMADIVWGIEKIVPNNLGRGKDGMDAVNKFRTYLKKIKGSADDILPIPTDPDAKLTYQLSSTEVPENWIPFMAVHKTSPPSNRRINFQRSAMPRIIDQYNNSMIRPRTEILNYGLRTITAGLPAINGNRNIFMQNYGFPLAPFTYKPLFIQEEEIPREGTLVETTFQRARWLNGKTVSWIGRKKTVGRGEGNSGLTFDNINNVK